MTPRTLTAAALAAAFFCPPAHAATISFDGFLVLSGQVRVTGAKGEPVILTRGGAFPQTKKTAPATVEILSEKAVLNAAALCLIGARKGAAFELRSYSTAGHVSKIDGAAATVRYISGDPPEVKFGPSRVAIERGEISFAARARGKSSIYAKDENSAARVRTGKGTVRLDGSNPKLNFIEGKSVKFIKAPAPKPASRPPLPPYEQNK